MLRIAICDDDTQQLNIICKHAGEYFAARSETVSFRTFNNASDFIDALDKHMLCDIALLDIYMPGILGTELAREIKQKSPGTEIIFLTTSDEFAIEAFSIRAIDYLLKPFTKEQFASAMDLALGRISQRQREKVAFRTSGGSLCIEEIAQIAFIESFGHNLSIHLKDGRTLQVRRTLQDLQNELESLAPNQFVSPNRGILVNLAEVQKIDSEYIYIANQQLPLGKRKFRDFQKLYFDFMFAEASRSKSADTH